MNISGIADITDLARNNEIPMLRDNKTPDEIFDSVCNDIRQVCKQIKSTIRQCASTNATTTNVEKTVIMPEITSTVYQKASIINKLTNNIKDSNELDFPQFRNEAIMSLPVMMAKETSSCSKAVEMLHRIKKNNDAYLKVLSEADEVFTEMESAEIDEDDSSEELERIHKKVKAEVKEVKKDLVYVIETLFNDEEMSGNMYALLEELVKKSQSQREEDEWYEATHESVMPLIMMLCQAGALRTHPHNSKLFKLII